MTACTTIPADSRKKKDTPTGVFLFAAALLLRKSGRLRAGDLTCKGNPTKVSLAYIPFLAIYRSAHGQQNLWAITKRNTIRQDGVSFGQVGQRLERARAQREKHAGGMFWCLCACGGPAGPPASLVARSKKHHPSRVVFFSACQKRLAEFAARRRQKIEIIFHRDMCVGKNTSQTASVEFCRLRQNYARSRLQAFCRKNPEGFSTVSPPPSGRWFFAFISSPAGCRRAGSAPRGPGGCGESRGRRRRIRSRYRYARP